MSKIYIIQKLAHPSLDPNSDEPRTWVEAFGLNRKSWPEAASDEEAIEHFRAVSARARSPRRLVSSVAHGLNASVTILDIANVPTPKSHGRRFNGLNFFRPCLFSNTTNQERSIMATFTIQTWNSEFSAWRVPVRNADFSTLEDAANRVRQLREGSVYRVLDPEGNIALTSQHRESGE